MPTAGAENVRAVSPAVYRRRRLVAGAVTVGAVGAVVLGVKAVGGEDGAPEPRRPAAALPAATPRPKELPRGGRTIFPDYRVVAFYGAPQDRQLGVLGIGTPARAAAKLERQARPYARKTRPVLPALELVAVIAANAPGEGGRYNLRQPDGVIRRYLKAARRAKALLLLDIQPGRSDFLTEAMRLRRWLREPDVGLALDPEWRMGPDEVPGRVIGHVEAREVNATTRWLAGLVERYRLPQKLLVLHEFTEDMVPEAGLEQPKGLAYVLNVDGFGTQAAKVGKYHALTRRSPGFRRGFKLFYEEDTETMSPAQVMRLTPRPDVVVYE